MEKSVAEEELLQQTEPTDLAAKLSGSIINVDLMVVDVSIPVKKNETENCQHFSIRGYVAEMREKNRKTCEPFASGTSKNNLEEQLPPMIVPKHRYWRCEDCLPKICAGYPTKEGRIISKCRQNGLVSDGTCVSMPSCSDAAVTPSEMQQSAAMEISGQSKIHIDASAPNINAEMLASSSSHGKEISADIHAKVLTSSEIRASSSNHNKDMSADIREMALTDDEIGSGNVKNQKNGGEPLISLQLNKKGLVHQTDQNMTGPDAHDISPPVEFHKRINGIAAEICLHKKKNTAEDRREVVQASYIFTNNATNEPVCVGAAHSTRTTSIQVEERDNASSDSEGILAGCSDHRQHNDDLNGLPRRRTRKVRLLTDLLNEKDSLEIDCIRKENTSFSETTTTSTGLEKAVAQEAKAPHEDIAKDKQSPPRKRKMSHLEDSRSLEIKDIANVSKKVRLSRVNSERPRMTNEVCNSESEESHLSKHKNDRPLSLFKKKALIQVDSDPVGDHVAVGASEQSVAPLDTLHVASTASGRAETKKCFHLSKGKRPLVENGDKFLSPANCSTLGEVPTPKNQTDSMLSVSGRIQFQSENAASTKVCLDLSLGRPPSSEGTAKNNICKSNPAFLKQKNRPGRYPHWKNKNFVRQSSVLNNPSPSQSVRKGLMLGLDGRIAHSTGITLEKNCSSFFEETGFILQEKVDGKGKNEEVQGHSEASRKQNDQRAYKAFEKGSSDDIPMEIVELMAKNQYERQMAGGEGPSISKRTDCSKTGSVRVQGNHPMKWLEAQMPSMTNIPYANATNGIAMAIDNGLATNANATNFSDADERHFKLHHLGGNQLKCFSAVSENQQKLCSGVQYPISDSSIIGSQSSEGATPVWLSKNKNIPSGLSVPQKYIPLSNNIEAHARCAETKHKGRTISDIKSDEMRMQNESQLILSKPRGGKLYPKPRGSLDPYSNETIPAMQLLSLVHKGMSSSASGSADANRFNEISFSSCDYHPKFSTDERNKVWDRSFYLPQHQGAGVYCAGESSSRPSSSLSTGFKGQISFGSQNLEEQLGVTKSLKSFSRSGGLQHPCPRKEKLHQGKRKGALGNSNSLKISQQYGRLENRPRAIDLEANSVSGTSLPSKRTSKDGPCSFNQNPAEFSIPEPGNKYTISGKDLKILKKDFNQERSYSVNVDSRKRQRPTKVSTGRKQARRHAS